MISEDSAQFTQFLQQELAWATALNELLQQEQSALETNRYEVLVDLAEQKQTLSDTLEKNCQNRLSLLNIHSEKPQQHNTALQSRLLTLPPQEGDQIKQLNNQLSHTLQQGRERNAVNGQIIATNLVSRKALFSEAAAGGATDAAQVTYDSKGEMKNNSRSGRFESV